MSSPLRFHSPCRAASEAHFIHHFTFAFIILACCWCCSFILPPPTLLIVSSYVLDGIIAIIWIRAKPNGQSYANKLQSHLLNCNHVVFMNMNPAIVFSPIPIAILVWIFSTFLLYWNLCVVIWFLTLQHAVSVPAFVSSLHHILSQQKQKVVRANYAKDDRAHIVPTCHSLRHHFSIHVFRFFHIATI